MILCGVDPDTKATGVALLDTETGRLTAAVIKAAGRLHADRRVPMAQAIADFFHDEPLDGLAIEWQHIRPRGERRPNDIMAVQAVAGMVLAAARPNVPIPRYIWLPVPSAWRGTVKKEIVQARILASLPETVRLSLFNGISKADQSHAIDAVGLVYWLKKQLNV